MCNGWATFKLLVQHGILAVVIQPFVWKHKLFHHALIHLAAAIIAKARNKVVSGLQKLKPRCGQEHVHIVLPHDIDITYVRQHFHKILLYQDEVVLSTVEAKYGNLVYPSHPSTSELFRQTVCVLHGIVLQTRSEMFSC